MQFLLVFVETFFNILMFAIIIRVLLSWVPGAGGQLRVVLNDVTEPILGPFRRIIPRMGMIDISPIIAIFVIDITRSILLQIIVSFV